MSRLRKVVPSAAAAVLMAGVLSVPAPASAGAAGCSPYALYVAGNASNSGSVGATSGCDGVWIKWAHKNIKVKGQYYKNGSWRSSSLSAKWVTTLRNKPIRKIIGNTSDGRKVRGKRVGGSNTSVFTFA